MEATVVPEPPEEERQAVLEALAEPETTFYDTAWRQAALREIVEPSEP